MDGSKAWTRGAYPIATPDMVTKAGLGIEQLDGELGQAASSFDSLERDCSAMPTRRQATWRRGELQKSLILPVMAEAFTERVEIIEFSNLGYRLAAAR